MPKKSVKKLSSENGSGPPTEKVQALGYESVDKFIDDVRGRRSDYGQTQTFTSTFWP